MRVRLIAVGTKMPAWVNQGYEEYSKRLNQDLTLELVEIAAGKRGKNADVERITHKEGEQMLAAVHPQGAVRTPGSTSPQETLGKPLFS